MENRPLISIIVPVYNVEKWINRCVNSICKQSYQNLQIILVDDGSTDSSGILCDQFADMDMRIKVIHKSNGGLSDARNIGLAHATGGYVSFIDSDDWVLPQFIETLYNTIIKNNCDLAECDYLKTMGKVHEERFDFKVTVYNTEQAMEEHIKDNMFKQVVWNKLYCRTVLTVPFEKGKYHEDTYWTYQILAQCERLAHIEAPLYCYFQRGDSIMGEAYSLKRLDAVEATERRCRFVSEKYPDLAGIVQGQFIGFCMYHSQLLMTNSALDTGRALQQNLFKRAEQVGRQWYREKKISIKQRVWLWLYLKFPFAVCQIRNKFNIGV